MKETMQQRMDQIRHLAANAAKSHAPKAARSTSIQDSLSTAIRNEREAAIFQEELNAAIKAAHRKKK